MGRSVSGGLRSRANTMTQKNTNFISMPAPTAWPMVAALGITLLLTGVVTHFIVSIAGLALVICGAIGWWRDVLPVEKHEPVAVITTPAEPASSPRRAVRLRAGEGGH